MILSKREADSPIEISIGINPNLAVFCIVVKRLINKWQVRKLLNIVTIALTVLLECVGEKIRKRHLLKPH